MEQIQHTTAVGEEEGQSGRGGGKKRGNHSNQQHSNRLHLSLETYLCLTWAETHTAPALSGEGGGVRLLHNGDSVNKHQSAIEEEYRV